MDGDSDALRGMMDITSDRSYAFEEKLEMLLHLGREYLGVEVGFLTEFDDGTQRIVAAAGDHELIQVGETCPAGQSYCRKTVEETEALTVQHAEIEGWEDDPAYREFGLESYIGTRIEVQGGVYGTFCFADVEPRPDPFSEAEEVFVELLAAWVEYELAQQAVAADLQRERDRLEEFVDVVSHDLRTPLSVAKGQLELMRDDPENEADHLQRAEAALDRTDELLGNLLSLAKAGDEIGELEPVDLAEIAVRSWQTVETDAATLDVAATNVVLADPVRLSQLFENLFGNAVEHAGPDVTVTVTDTERGFVVVDDGPGISESDREKVLEMGYSTTSRGSGFGLHIVARIADAHGWSVDVGESPSGGARFTFTGVKIGGQRFEPTDAAEP